MNGFLGSYECYGPVIPLWSRLMLSRLCHVKGVSYDFVDPCQQLCGSYHRMASKAFAFHYVKKRALFFVQDISTASALMDVSYKIYDQENQKIPIFVNTSAVPYSVRDKLEPEEMEQLKLTMNKRYDISQKALDLQMLRFDPGMADSSNSMADLVGLNIDIILNRRNCMAATLQIIEKNFPELLSLNLCNNKLYRLDGLSDLIQMAPTVKNLNLSRNELNSTWELRKMKGLKLEELWLDGNPLCSTFPDQSTYIWSVQNLFTLSGYLCTLGA
ncbi:Nuclear RNA export factor 2 [Pteropus alecto]|uniref:Nuclear RNA export factor 2 n=1 Tax=Pteropus alecto TaxID=9402 RepID=L5JVI7_PTEAL|nr:Nuclear RNA export factor 2 [Pteropus alecto]